MSSLFCKQHSDIFLFFSRITIMECVWPSDVTTGLTVVHPLKIVSLIVCRIWIKAAGFTSKPTLSGEKRRNTITLCICDSLWLALPQQWKYEQEQIVSSQKAWRSVSSALKSLPLHTWPSGFLCNQPEICLCAKKSKAAQTVAEQISVVSSLASLQLRSDHLLVSDRQTSHTRLRPVTPTCLCFGRHVGF